MQSVTSAPATFHGLVRSAIVLSACVFGAALLLTPFAFSQTGTSGPSGLFFAAAICLLSGWGAEAISISLARTSPLGAALLGMMVRIVVPLGVCVALLATGQNGHDHLRFIGYLLTLYMVTLGLETWLAVKRLAGPSIPNRSPH